MSSIDDLLAKRTAKKTASHEPTKVQALAKASNEGQLSGFGGIFKEPTLAKREEEALQGLLKEFATHSSPVDEDLVRLRHITREVKAIHTQAILLHGERIKQAQELLKRYKEGAFTRWLVTAYGNRQTPYNFLQFYEFFQVLSVQAKQRAEELPRQAMYTLATRSGEIEKKQQFLLACENGTKNELLDAIRRQFPLQEQDKRSKRVVGKIMAAFTHIEKDLRLARLSDEERALLVERTKRLLALLTGK